MTLGGGIHLAYSCAKGINTPNLHVGAQKNISLRLPVFCIMIIYCNHHKCMKHHITRNDEVRCKVSNETTQEEMADFLCLPWWK